MEGVEKVKETAEMEEKVSTGLLGKLLGAFDGLRTLLEGWEHAFDWEKAKEEGLQFNHKTDIRFIDSNEGC